MKLIKKLLSLVLFVTLITGCVDGGSLCNVTFQTDGGTQVNTIEVQKGEKALKPVDPEKEGYVFDGWFEDSEFKNEFSFDNPINKNIVIYAKWSKLLTVSFVTNCDAKIENLLVKEGETLKIPSIQNGEYTLMGWYTDSALVNKFDLNTAITSDITLYAKWVDKTEVFNVKFNIDNNFVVEDQQVVYSNTVINPGVVKNDIFEVTGWYEDAELTKPFDFKTEVYEDLELYAKVEQYAYFLAASPNRNWVSYNNNIKIQENKKIEFVDRTNTYMVGDDNGWKTLPIYELGVVNESGDAFDSHNGIWTFTLNLYELIESNYVLVTDYSTYIDQFDKVSCSIDFNENAIGKSFKVEIVPDYLTPKQMAPDQIGEYTVMYICTVIDGFNAYTAKDLAYIDNRTNDNYANNCYQDVVGAWNKFKQENNMDLNYHPANVIIHSNIQITKDDLPEEFFFSEEDADFSSSDSDYTRTLGSLRDYLDVYCHHLESNESFAVYGNYYNLDSSLIPIVTRENDNITPEGQVISHSVLIRFEGEQTGNCVLKNVSLLGNAPKVENKQKGGGLILFQVQGPKTVISNTLSTSFFITLMAEETKESLVFENSKSYDSFNSFLYNWGSPNFVVSNCEFESAGGPIIIQDHIHVGKEDESIAHTKFSNCKMDSYVAGSEGWFSVVNATVLVPTIKQLDAILNAYGKTFLISNADNSVKYFNFVGVIKSGNSQSFTSEKVKGSLTFDNAEFNFGEGNPYVSGGLDQSFALGAPAFQGDVVDGINGFAIFNGEYLIDVTGQPILDPSNNLFTGDYISIYYNGMCIVFKLNDLQA